MKEALFLTVWLRRQELEVRRVQILANGFSDQFRGDNKATTDAFKEFVDAAFPFAAKTRSETDKKMVEAMKKETAKGPILFSPVKTPSPLIRAAKTMQMPDEFRQKLQQRTRGRLK